VTLADSALVVFYTDTMNALLRMSKFGVFTALTFRLVFLFNVNVCSSNVNCVPSFVRNACYEHGSDVRFMKMTYDVCVENCVRRASCVSVNFHAQMGYCVLHTVEAITKVPCALDGMVFSRKADWTEVRYRVDVLTPFTVMCTTVSFY